MFAQLVAKLRKAAPQIEWHAMLENVASMTDSDRSTITQELEPAYATKPYWIDAAIYGPCPSASTILAELASPQQVNSNTRIQEEAMST